MKKVFGVLLTFIITLSTSSFFIHAETLTVDQLYSQAYNATNNAMINKTQKSINEARAAVDALKGTGASWAIGVFSHHVDIVQQPILVNIVKAIEAAKNNPSQANVNAAKATIDNDLPLEWKNSYSSAIDIIEQGLINDAVNAYNTAVNSKSPTDIIIAMNKINDILTSTDKNVSQWAYNFSIAVQSHKTIDYVALGDSVAAGVRGGVGAPGSELGSDYGYTDDIAKKLKDSGVLGSFNEQFAVSGMTAKVLAENSSILNNPGAAQYLIQNAEIVTLDIGANDLLGPLYSYVAKLTKIQDAKPEEVIPILNQIAGGLNGPTGLEVEGNIETILQNILNANANVKIYVMGYYNPLPALSETYKVDLNTPMEYFNKNIIQKAISNVITKNNGASISYVDTMAAMANNSDKNLVPTDIHPTEAGYQVIADEFWKQIKLNLSDVK